MLGIPADAQRPRMEEALDAIMALLRGETVTMRDRLVHAAATRACSSRRTATRASTSRSRRRSRPPAHAPRASTASGCSRSRRPRSRAWTCSGTTGTCGTRSRASTATSPTARSGGSSARCTSRRRASRRETEVEYGIAQFSRYFTHVLPAGPGAGRHRRRRSSRTTRRAGFAVIGTPDDAIAQDRGARRGEQRRVRRVPALRPRLGDTRQRPSCGRRAVRAVRDAALHRSARRRPRRRANGSPAAAASSSAGPPTRSPRRSRTTPPSAPTTAG